MPVSYQLDITGINPSNFIPGESHLITELNADTYNIIIPTFAPFYINDFAVKHINDVGIETPLQPDSDYFMCLPFIGAMRSLGKPVYGGITISNSYINGVLEISYRTLGGDWAADAAYVKNYLAERIYNPRITNWDLVTNVQQTFPPIEHNNDFDYVYGQGDLIEAVNSISAAIMGNSAQSSALIRHIADTTNIHNVTADQIGLGLVENLPISDEDDIIQVNQVNTYITLAQAIRLINRMRPI